MAAKKEPGPNKSDPKITMIVSDDKEPLIKIRAGQRLEVQTVAVKGADLKSAKGIAARLCGGTSTCLALVELPKV